MLKRIIFAIALFTTGICRAADDFKVIDGDSLEYGNERIRIMNIDAPEFFQKCYDASGWKYLCGFEATEFLRKLMAGKIRCDRYGKDRYGRSLAQCFLADGTDVGAAMVLNGWAVAYGDMYQAEEAQARGMKKGIWKGKFMRPELFRALKKSHRDLQNKKR